MYIIHFRAPEERYVYRGRLAQSPRSSFESRFIGEERNVHRSLVQRTNEPIEIW